MKHLCAIAMLLCGTGAAWAQQDGSNVVPRQLRERALRSALKNPTPPALMEAPIFFASKAPGAAELQPCVIRLREAPGKQTNDAIATPGPAPFIDPKMAIAPPVPPCETQPAAERKPRP